MRRLRPFLLAVLCLWCAGCREEGSPVFKGLTHAAYVWRQGWDDPAAASLAAGDLPAAVGELVVLVGECGLGQPPRAVRPPWSRLQATGRRLALAVRIGTRSALGGDDEPDLREGFGLLDQGLAAARAAGLAPTGVQVDFDCPERLLAAYAARLRQYRAAHPDLRLTVTALPSWLEAPGCAALFAAVDSFTLQLHATRRPNAQQPSELIAAGPALAWIARAEKFRRPFRVALPTYAYLACFARSGTFLGVRAETRELPAATAWTRPLPADPQAVGQVLAVLASGRHPWVEGIDWFRLPFPGDRQNWTRAGLAKVLAGERLQEACVVEVQTKGPLYDLVVVNPTEQPLPLPRVRVRWHDATQVAADAAQGWMVGPALREGQDFPADERAGFLAPGERRVVGWLRLDRSAPGLRTEAVREQVGR